MNYQNARTAMFGVFRTGWDGETAIAEENRDFDSKQVTEFVRISIIPTGGEQASKGRVGHRIMRSTATLIIQVFTKSGKGSGHNAVLCQKAREIFYGGVPGVRIRDHGFRPGSISDEWYQQNVNIDFEYDEEG